MCGICGYISKRTISQEQLSRMNDTMIRRGPNDAGAEVFAASGGYTAGLAQRRLSILDLSPAGHQPMHSAGGEVTIVYNGEIYNYQEIRRELPDYPFRSSCDTEVILAAYLAWGIDCVRRFNGMFAFALYDHRSGELFLARDRMGVKPLYYWLEDAAGEDTAQDSFGTAGRTGIVFASELKPIMACPGFERTIRSDILARYLSQEYIAGPETVFKDVYKLEPGTILRFKDGILTKSVYWNVFDVYRRMQESPVTDYMEARQELKKLLQLSVRRRLIADVPLGCFLSGGYDSSLVCALAQEELGEVPLKTFSIGFEDPAYDESAYAEAVARHLGCDHTTLRISEKDMLELVSDLPLHFDEPMADSSEIPTMLVSALAKQKVSVALSGDAGDEFFCGYNIYEKVEQARKLRLLGAAAHGIGQLRIGGKLLEEHYPFRLRTISRNTDPKTWTQFGEGKSGALAKRLVKGSGLPVNYPVEDQIPSKNWQVRRMLLDMATYLPDDILVKVDRAGMKYSLENRCPLLDKDVMEYSFRIDHSFKYHRGIRKYILKDIVYDYIPKELMDRPKKGFSVPLSDWLRGPLRGQLLDYADRDFLFRQGLFAPEELETMLAGFLRTGDAGSGTGANYSGILWSFFVFQQWYDCYIGSNT